jgi:hypothetical protein
MVASCPWCRATLSKGLPLVLFLLPWCFPTAAVSLPPNDVQHLIVTTDPLATEMRRLADHWSSEGVSTSVVTLAWIQDHTDPGPDLPATIRAFLRAAHDEWGVRSVVLGGDTDVVPARFARSTFYPPGGYTDLATDLYYACLDGDWDADGDGIYGEVEGDNADLLPELAVGRAPVSNPAEAAVFVDKTLVYLTASVGPSPAALMLAEVLNPEHWEPGMPILGDGAELAEQYATLLEGATPPFTLTRRYENHMAYLSGLPLTKALAMAAMSGGDSRLVHYVGRGNLNVMSMVDGTIGPADVATLQNEVPFFLTAMFPGSAAITYDCLLEDFLTHPAGGAAVALGSNALVFLSSVHAFQMEFYTKVVADPHAGAGEALRRTLEIFAPATATNTIQRWQQLTVNLLGDPLAPIGGGTISDVPPSLRIEALQLYPSSPNPFNPTVSISFRLGDELGGPVRTTVQIVDLSGRVLTTVVDDMLVPGLHTTAWSGRDASGRLCASGSYLVTVRAGDLHATGRLTLLK